MKLKTLGTGALLRDAPFTPKCTDAHNRVSHLVRRVTSPSFLIAKSGRQISKKRAYKKQNRRNATPQEIIVQKILNRNKIYYRFQKIITKSSRAAFYIVDFYLIEPYRICLEVDGFQHLVPMSWLNGISDSGKSFMEISDFQVFWPGVFL